MHMKVKMNLEELLSNYLKKQNKKIKKYTL